MAKKGNRIQVILECTEHKATGLPGTSRYITNKNKKNTLITFFSPSGSEAIPKDPNNKNNLKVLKN